MPIVIVLLFVGILMGVGLTIMTSMQEALYSSTTATSANESLAIANKTGITLKTGDSMLNGVCGSVTEIYNATGDYKIGIGNITQVGCTITNATKWAPTISNDSVVNYTYSYTYDVETTASNATGDASNAIGDISHDWIPIIVVMVAAGIVLAALLGAFGQKRY